MSVWNDITTGKITTSNMSRVGGSQIEDDGNWIKITCGSDDRGALIHISKVSSFSSVNADYKTYKVEYTIKSDVAGGPTKYIKTVSNSSNVDVRELLKSPQHLKYIFVNSNDNTDDNPAITFKGLAHGDVVYINKTITVYKMGDRVFKQPLNYPYGGIVIDYIPGKSMNEVETVFSDIRLAGAKTMKITIESQYQSPHSTRDQETAQFIYDMHNIYIPLLKKYRMKAYIDILEPYCDDRAKCKRRVTSGWWNPHNSCLGNVKYMAREIAKAFRDIPINVIFGYSFISDPLGSKTDTLWANHNGAVYGYHRLQEELISIVRQFEVKKAIIISNGYRGNPDFQSSCPIYEDDNIIYNINSLDPREYTRQGKDGRPYPKNFDSTVDDRLKASLNAIDLFRDHNANVPVQVGFSTVVNYAGDPNDAVKYLTSLFKYADVKKTSIFYSSVGGDKQVDPRYTATSPTDTPRYDLTNPLWGKLKKFWGGFVENVSSVPITPGAKQGDLTIEGFTPTCRTKFMNTKYGLNDLRVLKDSKGVINNIVRTDIARFDGSGEHIESQRLIKFDKDFTIMIAFVNPENATKTGTNYIVGTDYVAIPPVIDFPDGNDEPSIDVSDSPGNRDNKLTISYNYNDIIKGIVHSQIGKYTRALQILPNNHIHAICIVWDSTNKKISVASEGRGLTTPEDAVFDADTENIIIGAQNLAGDNPYKGYIIGDIVLSEVQATSLDFAKFWVGIKDIQLP